MNQKLLFTFQFSLLLRYVFQLANN